MRPQPDIRMYRAPYQSRKYARKALLPKLQFVIIPCPVNRTPNVIYESTSFFNKHPKVNQTFY